MFQELYSLVNNILPNGFLYKVFINYMLREVVKPPLNNIQQMKHLLLKKLYNNDHLHFRLSRNERDKQQQFF